MAINFPPITVDGQTYDYQGVRYTAKVTGIGPIVGYWRVTTPGTYGVATPAEIDAGVDGVKYVSPAALEASKYNNVQASGVAYDDNNNGIGITVQQALTLLAKEKHDYIYNGQFKVTQRVTANTTGAALVYGAADRWWMSSGNGGLVGLNAEVNSSDGNYGALINITGGNLASFGQNIPAINDLAGKTVTFGYDVYSSSSISYDVSVNTFIGAAVVSVSTDTDSAPGTWTRKFVTFTLPSTMTADTIEDYVRIQWNFSDAGTLNIRNVGLVEGTHKLLKKTEELTSELARCRYFFRRAVKQDVAIYNSTFVQNRVGIHFEPMRKVPNMVLENWISVGYSNWNGNGAILVGANTGGFAYITAADPAYVATGIIAQITYSADSEIY